MFKLSCNYWVTYQQQPSRNLVYVIPGQESFQVYGIDGKIFHRPYPYSQAELAYMVFL